MILSNPFTQYEKFGGKCKVGDIAPFVLAPGSKTRVEQIAKLFDEAHKITDYHEFLVYTGSLKGVPISVCSTGIGGTSVAIAVKELVGLGANTIIRVGVTGTLQDSVEVGDLIIASGAIRKDRISNYFVPPEVPALSSLDTLLALAASCQKHKFKYHIGITATNGSFYCGEGRPGAHGYTQKFMNTIVEDFKKSGVLDWDTETSVLFILGALLGARVGRINGVLDSPRSNKKDPNAEYKAVKAAVDAILIISDWDKRKNNKNQLVLLPELKQEKSYEK